MLADAAAAAAAAAAGPTPVRSDAATVPAASKHAGTCIGRNCTPPEGFELFASLLCYQVLHLAASAAASAHPLVAVACGEADARA